ncbi:hypothetical protein [Pseudomonas graminis]|uniref:hypothetical protein n=1 Tax=Pseudomonas graminis TaxID=158627 RepID=UPI003C180012
MNTWYSKSLGEGTVVYRRLRVLNELRHQVCPDASCPYSLYMDAVSAETIVLFDPEQIVLATAFGALPCGQPHINGVRLIDLEYRPLPVTSQSAQLFSSPRIHLQPRFYAEYRA